jgi:hypothetical protein
MGRGSTRRSINNLPGLSSSDFSPFSRGQGNGGCHELCESSHRHQCNDSTAQSNDSTAQSDDSTAQSDEANDFTAQSDDSTAQVRRVRLVSGRDATKASKQFLNLLLRTRNVFRQVVAQRRG